jgi:hypothetical protein
MTISAEAARQALALALATPMTGVARLGVALPTCWQCLQCGRRLR